MDVASLKPQAFHSFKVWVKSRRKVGAVNLEECQLKFRNQRKAREFCRLPTKHPI